MFKRATKEQRQLSAMTDVDIGSRTLSFLSLQGLNASPMHYELGYVYLTERCSLLAKAIDSITMGGSRLTVDQAEHILSVHRAGRASIAIQGEEDPNCVRLRHQTLHLADLTAQAVATTGRFGRDLSGELAQLGREGLPVAVVISDMIARSGETERALADAAQRIETLRLEVAVAKDDARKDALTGLLNRRGMEAEVQEAGLRGGMLAMCDIDRFKAINDRWGHPVGDRVLRAVAAVIDEECSPHLVARWGGEEFVVLMHGIGLARAVAIIERANAVLGRRTFRVRETDEAVGAITLSAGVVPVGDEKLGDAIRRADALLYDAKRAGRNRVMCQGPGVAIAA